MRERSTRSGRAARSSIPVRITGRVASKMISSESALLQQADRLLLFARSDQPVQLHLPLGIDPRSSGGQPFHSHFAVRDTTSENSASVVRVVRLLVLDEFINH